jgi:hypothetical protein
MMKIKAHQLPVDQFVTQNLYLGSFCLCQGLKLVGKSLEGKKISIVFEGNAAKERAMAFYSGAVVEAKTFSDAYRSLKDFVFEK